MIIAASFGLNDEPADLTISAVYVKIVKFPENAPINTRKMLMKRPRRDFFSTKN